MEKVLAQLIETTTRDLDCWRKERIRTSKSTQETDTMNDVGLKKRKLEDKVFSINKVLHRYKSKEEKASLVEPSTSQGVVTHSFFSTTKGTKHLKLFTSMLVDQTLFLDPSIMTAIMY